AALTGRAMSAAAAARRAAVSPDWDLPRPLVEAGPALSVYAAMGGPLDSILPLAEGIEYTINQALPRNERLGVSLDLLGRPATLVFPMIVMPAIRNLSGGGDWLLDAQARFAGGDRTAADRVLHPVGGSRQPPDPATMTFDTSLPIARLLTAAGDTAGAIRWLDQSLASVRFRDHAKFGDPVEVATLVRAMMLRATLAAETGDRTQARRWASAVVALWNQAEAAFQQDVQQMRDLAD
ncbi:MAG: hypothetical protein OEV95_07380, partial [Gemmatimonadota bacterium]|nr:hypothetical protein [Gemmatimonadota bacterium]